MASQEEEMPEYFNDNNKEMRDEVRVNNAVSKRNRMTAKNREDSDFDLLDILIELSDASSDNFPNPLPSEVSADGSKIPGNVLNPFLSLNACITRRIQMSLSLMKRSFFYLTAMQSFFRSFDFVIVCIYCSSFLILSLDVGTNNVVPVEYFVILEMIGEKLYRYRIDGNVFILNYMKKITKKGNVSFLKMKFDRPSQERLEFDLRDPENANLRRYYILYPLHPNLYDTNRSHISKGLIQLLKHNNDRLYWQEFSVLPCGSIIYIMKMHKPVTPL